MDAPAPAQTVAAAGPSAQVDRSALVVGLNAAVAVQTEPADRTVARARNAAAVDRDGPVARNVAPVPNVAVADHGAPVVHNAALAAVRVAVEPLPVHDARALRIFPGARDAIFQ